MYAYYNRMCTCSIDMKGPREMKRKLDYELARPSKRAPMAPSTNPIGYGGFASTLSGRCNQLFCAFDLAELTFLGGSLWDAMEEDVMVTNAVDIDTSSSKKSEIARFNEYKRDKANLAHGWVIKDGYHHEHEHVCMHAHHITLTGMYHHFDPLKFWDAPTHKDCFPVHHIMARRHFSDLASSAIVEREGSKLSNVGIHAYYNHSIIMNICMYA